MDIVLELVAVARGSSTRVLVNDRVDVAVACGAAGVHLRGDSVPAAAVRRTVPAAFVVGVSVHSVAEAVMAGPHANYLVAGTVWPTASKPAGSARHLIGVGGLAQIAAAVSVPVLAIGGVTLERMSDVGRAGASGAAAIDLFLSTSPDRNGCRVKPLRAIVGTARTAFDTPRSAS